LKLAQVWSWRFPGALHSPSQSLMCGQRVGTVGYYGVGMYCTQVKQSTEVLLTCAWRAGDKRR